MRSMDVPVERKVRLVREEAGTLTALALKLLQMLDASMNATSLEFMGW